jgi:serine/threonine protein kinase
MSKADRTISDFDDPDAGDSGGGGSENCLPVGTRLAEFEITSVIGEGGFGIVYLAFDHSLQRTVAIKEYMPVALASRGADHGVVVRAKRHEEAFAAGLRSFINEARLLAQFDHSALVKVYRFWEQHETAYMAMRYYEGETFKDVVASRPEMVDEAWLKQILKPILEALDALYKVNILHRDISPENIMIQPNGEAVLLDFGAARQIVTGLTKSLTVILKPGYAPVEQYADDESMKQGPWTDIYSLSAVMYTAIAKKAPPTAVTRMLSDPIEPLHTGEHTGFARGFLAAIDRGLAVRPEDRPRSIAEFAALLGIDMSVPSHAEAVVRPFPSAPVSTPEAAPAEKPTKSRGAKTTSKPRNAATSKKGVAAPPAAARKRLWALLAGAGAIAVAGALWFANRPARAPGPAPIASSASAASSASPASARVTAQQAAGPKEEIISWDALNKERAAAPGSPASASAAAPPASPTAPAAVGAVPPKPADAAVRLAQRKAKAQQEAAARLAGGARSDEANAAHGPGTVALVIKPWGNVFADGEPQGVSPPLKKLTLSEGRHVIKITNPHFPEYVISVTVAAGKTTNVSRDFTSSTP